MPLLARSRDALERIPRRNRVWIYVLLLAALTATCAHENHRVMSAGPPAHALDVTRFGAKGDARVLSDCSISGGSVVLICSSKPFQPADIGKGVTVQTTGLDGVTFSSRITKVLSSAQVALFDAARRPLLAASVLCGSDDTAAFSAALDHARDGDTVWIPRGTAAYRLTQTIPIRRPLTLASDGAVIIPDIPVSEPRGVLFSIQSSGVVVDGIHFDGAGMQHTTELGGNRYCIQALGAPEHHLSAIAVRHCSFDNLAQRGGPIEEHWMLVWHGVYLAYVDAPTIESCRASSTVNPLSLSGSFVFLDSTTHAIVAGNAVQNTGWYSIHLDSDNAQFDIRDNIIGGEYPDARDFGASIDIMGQLGTADGVSKSADRDGRIYGNTISGVHNYAQALRLAGSVNVEVDHNVFENVIGGHDPDNNVIVVATRSVEIAGSTGDIEAGSATITHVTKVRSWIVGAQGTVVTGDGLAPGARVVAIDYANHSLALSQAAVATRSSMALAGYAVGSPPEHVRIDSNTFVARGVAQRALYAQGGRSGLGLVPGPGVDLRFDDNVLRSVDDNDYFSGIYVHGFDGGWRDVEIARNHVEVKGGPNQPSAGSVGITANAGAQMLGVDIVDNDLTFFARRGAATNINEVGIFLSRADDVVVRGNRGLGFFSGVLVDPSCGRRLRDLGRNTWDRPPGKP